MSGIASKLQHDREKAQGIGGYRRAVNYCNQDFQALRRDCLERRQLFQDESFEAVTSSLGFKDLGPSSYKVRGIRWKRPTATAGSWQAIASLTLNKQVLCHVVPPNQSFGDNYAGIFHFQFWQFGEWVDVVVDDRLPTRDGELLFVHSADGSEFWSALLEKAYAKLNGCYEALSGGSTTEGFEDFTGGIAEKHDLQKAGPHLFKIIRKALDRGSLLGCSINVSFRGDEVQLIRVRNPWGEVDSTEWRYVGSDDRDRLTKRSEDGEFWMSFSDFLRQYSTLEICNLTPDALTDNEYKKWALSEFEESWRRGSTAGGCRNYLDTYWKNPSLSSSWMRRTTTPDDGEKGCTIIVGLMQKYKRRMRKMGDDLEYMGFAIYERQVHMKKRFFQTNCSEARSETFTNTREPICPPAREYLVIPSTYKPDHNADFYLRSSRRNKLIFSTEIDDPIECHVKEELYKKRDTNKSGCICTSEMRMAVDEAGFSLSSPLHQIIVARYSEPDLSIDFDNFVGCLIRLEILFATFKTLDKDHVGKVELNTLEWLELTMVL
ncbi:LOW QUALITY PROTEIN: hypothetical protein CRUP_012371 [Coryphaenoides rupestris]|nr:LOW QUALITY PROTEIN: hypothetical protein CRUP_012371 [Coryphaenoides rupestris]